MAAMTAPHLVFILLLATARQVASANDWWMEEPYGNGTFNTNQVYTDNVTLLCEDGFTPGSAIFQYWIRPDLTVMRANQSEYFWTLDGNAGWQVTNDGDMIVTVLQEEQFGFYHCVLEDGGDVYVVKKAINYKGPYFGDLWPKYKMNTIIGCSAAGGILVLVLILWLIYYFRYQGDDDASSRSSDTSSTASSKQSPSTSARSTGNWTPERSGSARHRKVGAVVVTGTGVYNSLEKKELQEPYESLATDVSYINVGLNDIEIATKF